ncbi:PEP-CTERM sorting domain-containing protein [Cerasicoccus arenae]|uniref:Ice-binding protein C-terminal domain-containing protein n=1 Tax=Cerasicoccus arenae TaxID=424488 RepID=A0A8J3DKJ2_9BACT|nr:PEP-CTERM sorting domain-containing protein [Cerasicoccus arenae]MBK1858974.1 PEP-CTERM sorting domain-containing protein [Cerasicoccus arenae]GHC04185.1 hypothetical protein GCM10007047_21090 [Cerasicoccus arenae]
MRKYSQLLLLAFAITSNNAMAVLVINITDNGTNLTMTATGSYDFSALSPGSGVGLGNNAVVMPVGGGGAYGWKTPGPNADGYPITFDNTFAGITGAITPDFFSISHPFFVSLDNNVISIPNGSPQIASGINNIAVFNGYTLSSMGITPGVINVSWAGDSAIITASAAPIPEPSTYIALAGFATLGVFIWRRHKRS